MTQPSDRRMIRSLTVARAGPEGVVADWELQAVVAAHEDLYPYPVQGVVGSMFSSIPCRR